MALRLELKDGTRTLATYTRRPIVERMLDAGAKPIVPPARRKSKPGARKRRALGRGVAEGLPAAVE